MSSSPTAQPGQVRLEGLYEGPTSAWSPAADALADALRRSGAPDDCLQALVDGGRASLEASPALFPRGQFASDPGDAIGMALKLMIAESHGGRPEQWFSTLRVIEYRDDQLRESLVQVAADGVRVVARESDWTPAPPEPWSNRLRRQWPVGLLLLVALGAFAVKEREAIGRYLRSIQGLVSGHVVEVPADFQADAGPFGDWIRFTRVEVEGEELVVVLAPTDAYPATAAALDALRAGAGLDQRAALGALESGRARLRAALAEGMELPDQEIDLRPLRSGDPAEVRIDVAVVAGTRLASLELLP